MKRHVPLLLTIAAMAILSFLTFQFSRTTDEGSADRALLAMSVAVPTIPPPRVDACELAEEEPSGASKLSVTGACSGAISRAFTCSAGEEALIGSTHSPVDAEDDFVLVVMIPGFNGARSYRKGMLFAQIAGARGTSRWTNRATPITVDHTGIIHVESSDLDAEPGTSTEGSIVIEGSLECG
jgi:hypothetical protein